jgi:hypothetical protein
MDFSRYCIAARVDPTCANDARRLFLYGRATAPRGFFRLQEPPLSLSSYQAARLLHYCVDARPNEKTVDVVEALFAYAKTGDDIESQHTKTLSALVRRAGVTESHKVQGLVHAFMWMHKAPVDELIFLGGGGFPYVSLLRAIDAEVAHARRLAWTPTATL